MDDIGDIKWCKLYGRLAAVIADGEDSDDKPDISPLSGKITLTPSVSSRSFLSHTGDSLADDISFAVAPITIDVRDGYLQMSGNRYVYLLSQAPGIDEPLQWMAKFQSLTDARGNRYQPGSFHFNTVPGGVLSLSRVVPVVGYEQRGVIRGPAGPPGPPGPPGSGGSGGSVFSGPSDPPDFIQGARPGDTWINTLNGNTYILN